MWSPWASGAQRFEERSDGPSLQVLQRYTVGAKTWRQGDRRPEYEQAFYEIPFTEVPPVFIAKRQVVLKKGATGGP